MTSKIQCSRCANYFTDDHEAAVHIAGCRQYNGWTNYETWAIALWLDNERGSYEYWRDLAGKCASDTPSGEEGRSPRAAVHRIVRQLQAEHEEAANLRLAVRADVFNDLIGAALSEVCWVEIAEHFFEA